MQRLTRTRGTADGGTADGGDLTWLMLVDALVLRVDAAIRWLDRCEARVVRSRQGAQR